MWNLKVLPFVLANTFCLLKCDEIHCPFPFDNDGEVITIDIQLQVLSLAEFRDVQGSLEIKGTLASTWKDSCSWNLLKKIKSKQTANRTYITTDCKYFWLPLISQDNSNNARAYANTWDMPVEVHEDGTIIYYGRKSWPATCDGQFSKFPFDTHHCHLEFNLWYSTDFLRFGNSSLYFPQGPYYNPDGLLLFSAYYQQPVKFQSTYDCDGKVCLVDRVKFGIVLKRKGFPYYFSGIFIPIFCLSFLQLSSFFIPYTSVDRIGFSGTIFVAEALVTSEISSLIPQTAEHIFIVTSSTLASFASMASTVFFIFCFRLRNTVDQKWMKKLQIFATFIFIGFSIILYISTIVCIAI